MVKYGNTVPDSSNINNAKLHSTEQTMQQIETVMQFTHQLDNGYPHFSAPQYCTLN